MTKCLILRHRYRLHLLRHFDQQHLCHHRLRPLNLARLRRPQNHNPYRLYLFVYLFHLYRCYPHQRHHLNRHLRHCRLQHHHRHRQHLRLMKQENY